MNAAAEMLFDLPATQPASTPIWMHRQELARQMSEAVALAEGLPPQFGRAAEVVEILRNLAADGDTTAAREELDTEFDVSPRQSAGWHDAIAERINLIGYAFHRLHRAELRIVGKERR